MSDTKAANPVLYNYTIFLQIVLNQTATVCYDNNLTDAQQILDIDDKN